MPAPAAPLPAALPPENSNAEEHYEQHEYIYKIALQREFDAWTEQGKLSGSQLDINDGFVHGSDAAMVKKVADMFFRDVEEPVLLLMMDVVKLAHFSSEYAVEYHDGAADAPPTPPTDPHRVVVHRLPDGCRHVYTTSPLPIGVVDRAYPLPRPGDGPGGFAWPASLP